MWIRAVISQCSVGNMRYTMPVHNPNAKRNKWMRVGMLVSDNTDKYEAI